MIPFVTIYYRKFTDGYDIESIDKYNKSTSEDGQAKTK